MIMELLGIAASAVCLWFVFRYTQDARERRVSAFALLVGGFRHDGWPVGVQEEDRDRPWGSRARTSAGDARHSSLSGSLSVPGAPVYEDVLAAVPAQPVRAAVRGRH